MQNFYQKKNINYREIYTLIINDFIIQIVFTVTAVKEYKIKQINFITAFLNKILLIDKQMYIKQFINFEKKKSLVCYLNQELYSLKQITKL